MLFVAAEYAGQRPVKALAATCGDGSERQYLMSKLCGVRPRSGRAPRRVSPLDEAVRVTFGSRARLGRSADGPAAVVRPGDPRSSRIRSSSRPRPLCWWWSISRRPADHSWDMSPRSTAHSRPPLSFVASCSVTVLPAPRASSHWATSIVRRPAPATDGGVRDRWLIEWVDWTAAVAIARDRSGRLRRDVAAAGTTAGPSPRLPAHTIRLLGRDVGGRSQR